MVGYALGQQVLYKVCEPYTCMLSDCATDPELNALVLVDSVVKRGMMFCSCFAKGVSLEGGNPIPMREEIPLHLGRRSR